MEHDIHIFKKFQNFSFIINILTNLLHTALHFYIKAPNTNEFIALKHKNILEKLIIKTELKNLNIKWQSNA